MSVVSSDLKWYKSASVTNTGANGGRRSSNEVIGGVKNNIFPDVTQDERLAGLIRYRKVFAALMNTAGDILINPVQHLKTNTPGEDRIEMFTGTPTDVQTDAIAGEPTRKFGAAPLTTNVSAGATSLAVTLEDASQVLFDATGNHIYIGNGVQEEYHKVVASSKSGNQVTLTLDTGDMIANNYLSTNTIVASVISQAEMKPVVTSVTLTSSAGTFNNGVSPVTGTNKGSVEGVFTLTFSSSTNFTCTEALLGAIGSGNISSDFNPNNPLTSTRYLSVLAAGWGGTLALGDTLVIVTHAADQAIWFKQIVPAGSNSYSGNNFRLRHGGESA